MRSFADIRRNYQQSYMNQLRNYCIGMGFLLLNIFLGLLGTFWFRTQQRSGSARSNAGARLPCTR